MRNILKTILTAGMLLVASALYGQETVKERLASRDPVNGARITVTEKGDAVSILRMLRSSVKADKISVFRVCIFNDNSQNARSEAFGAQEKFNELFTDVPSYMDYREPYFKVSVGNCLTKEEAITLWGRLKNAFPHAFLTNETVDVSVLSD